MSGIARRTAYINYVPIVAGEKKGPKMCAFIDTATAYTTVGSMLEPFIINDLRGFGSTIIPANSDRKDMMRRVDEIKVMTNSDLHNAEDDTQLHNYNQWFQVGPY